jgi:cell division protein ZapE
LSQPGPGEASLTARYRALVATGAIASDPAQAAVVERLEVLNRALADDHRTRRSGLIGRFLGARESAPRGVYIHGEVGRGKTMLMDEFFALTAAIPKRRVHFNEFMTETQERIHVVRRRIGGDPIAPVAAMIAHEVRLLCLDEFQVEDIADAMILSRLFERLFAAGTVLVATSNVPPDELYRNGLNRSLFLPFIALLRHHVAVARLDAATDYRLGKLTGAPVYVTPLGSAATQSLDRLWQALTGTERGAPAALAYKGRRIAVPQAARGVARFAFADLCEQPLGAGDYQKIARAFHTLVIDGIPIIADHRRDVARRLILLIDTLYDLRVKLVASAAVAPDALYTAKSGDEAFAFRRTVSRLIEMRSAAYLGAAHGTAVPAGGGAPTAV